MFRGTNEGMWQPCPAQGCDNNHAFEMQNQKSEVLVHCVIMARRRERELNAIVDKAGEHVAKKASRHIDLLKKRLNDMESAATNKDMETRTVIASKNDEIQQLHWKIHGILDYQKSMQKQIESLLSQVNEMRTTAHSPTLAQQSQSDTENPPNIRDNYTKSPPNKRDNHRYRRVSHDPSEDRHHTETSHSSEEDSCSTQENEFV